MTSCLFAGWASLEFSKAMELEHTSTKCGCETEFTTPNYRLTTSPKREWRLVVTRDLVASKGDLSHSRRIPDIEELLKSNAAVRAELLHEEIIAMVLYTGPMVRSSSPYFQLLREHSLESYHSQHNTDDTVYLGMNRYGKCSTTFPCQIWSVSFSSEPGLGMCSTIFTTPSCADGLKISTRT